MKSPCDQRADVRPKWAARRLKPAYSPELNPVENLWHYLRSHYLSNRSYEDYALLAARTEAYRKLTPGVIRSVCRCPYLERAEQS